MNKKKGILLFEVAFVGLLASILSLFIFRAYGLFIKSGIKCLEYSQLISLAEKKVWDIQKNNSKDGIVADLDRINGNDKSPFTWRLDLEATDYENLKKGILTVARADKKKISYDTVIFLRVKEE